MDELKSKLKGLLGGSKQAKGAFKGTGHRLGSAPPSQPGPSWPAQPAAAAADRRPRLVVPPPQPAQPQQPQQQQQQPQQQAQPTYQQPVPQARPASPQAQHITPPAVQPQPVPQPQAALQSWQAEPTAEPLSEAADAVSVSVAQLASDPAGTAAAEVLGRLLANITASPSEAKFRRLRLSNPRIQSAVVDVSGGVELLLACGFEVVFEEGAALPATSEQAAGAEEAATEGFAVLPDDADLAPLRHALQLLGPLLPAPAAAAPSGDAAGAAGSRGGSSGAPAAPQQQQQQQAQPARQPQRQQRERVWDAPRERNTQVLLPTSVERDVPDWFFQRTGQELRAAFLAATRRRDQDQVLMTRAMRERLRGPRPTEAAFATIKVRFPEGISLQGEFAPGEPVAAVFAWVADCLSDPLHTYELVLPSRQPLELQAQSVREADLMPSVALLFRWTGQSATDMAHVPALRNDLLRSARPAAPSY